jgi:alpha 1,2-mannosyltransferase
VKQHPEYVAENNAMGFISDNHGEEYNLCHCKWPIPPRPANPHANISHIAVWSNFEIADMDFWRAPAYTAYVDHLEAAGGFYYEVCTNLPSPLLGAHSTRDALAVG